MVSLDIEKDLSKVRGAEDMKVILRVLTLRVNILRDIVRQVEKLFK